jgi:hypothetical protein
MKQKPCTTHDQIHAKRSQIGEITDHTCVFCGCQIGHYDKYFIFNSRGGKAGPFGAPLPVLSLEERVVLIEERLAVLEKLHQEARPRLT